MAKQPDKIRLLELEQKWLAGNLTKEEDEELNAWYNLPLQDIYVNDEDANSEELHKKKLFDRIKNEIDNSNKKKYNLKKWLVAASLLLSISTGIILFKSYKTQSNTIVYNTKELLPGKRGATIILADGKRIELNEFDKNYSTQSIPSQNVISKDIYNKLSTNRGQKFSFKMSDGTYVYLNALSSIRFPSSFDGPERKVYITGEVYLEVAKNPKQPFEVFTENNDKIKVLGTHFNVNTYKDNGEEKVTLLEGAIELSNSNKNNQLLNLIPGEQGTYNDSSYNKKNVNAEDYVDWKNDQFIFDGETLNVIMKRLSRWYVFDYSFEKESDKDILFTGVVSGLKPLSQILHIFSLTNNELLFSLNEHNLVIKHK